MSEINELIGRLENCQFPKDVNSYPEPYDYIKAAYDFDFKTDIALKNVLKLFLFDNEYQILINDKDESDEGISHLVINSKHLVNQTNKTFGIEVTNLKDQIAIFTNRKDAVLEFDEEMVQSYLYLIKFFGYSRGIMYSARGFDTKLLNFSKDCYPYSLQLLSFQDLTQISKHLASDDSSPQATFLVRELCKGLIQLIAEKGASSLDLIEWRDMERVLAELFWVNGFVVQLTASANDGGKDLVIHSRDNDKSETYYVEIKHWRSNQKVTNTTLETFVEVILKNNIQKGVFISTSGYSDKIKSANICIENVDVKLWGKNEISAMARVYMKNRYGLFEEDADLFKVF